MVRTSQLYSLVGFITACLLIVGCSSPSLESDLPSDASNCRLDNLEIQRANKAVSKDRDSNRKSTYTDIDLFYSNQVLKMILTNPQCFSSDVLSFVEQGSGRTRIYDYTPTSPIDPKSSYEESVTVPGLEITDDVKSLQSSLNSLFVNEDAYFYEEDEGSFELQSGEYGFLWSLISDETVKKKNQEFIYFKAKGSVRVEGSNQTKPRISIFFDFDNTSAKEVFCNSIRIESVGESFLIPGTGDCGWATLINKEKVSELLFLSDSETDYQNWIRFLSVLAYNEFTVRAVDEDGQVHVFSSRNDVIEGELGSDKGLASKRILSLLEANKALESGLVYEGNSN